MKQIIQDHRAGRTQTCNLLKRSVFAFMLEVPPFTHQPICRGPRQIKGGIPLEVVREILVYAGLLTCQHMPRVKLPGKCSIWRKSHRTNKQIVMVEINFSARQVITNSAS